MSGGESTKLTRAQRARRGLYRRLTALALLAAVVGGLVVADRWGIFGRDDVAEYDGGTFEVVRAVDGDTFDIDAPDRGRDTTRIRLWGVDTPETNAGRDDRPPEHFARRASAFTRSRTLGKTVALDLVLSRTRGKHGRLLAYVYLPDGSMLNRLLVAEGYAYADPRFRHPYQDEFERLQRQARRAGKGLWAEVTNDDLPYYYRDKLDIPAASAAADE